MARKTYETHFLLGARVQSSVGKSFSKIQKNMKNIRKTASYTEKTYYKLSRTIKTALGAAGIYLGAHTIVTGLRSFTNAAMEFEDQMADVANLLDGDVSAKIAKASKQTKRLAIQTGLAAETLNKGYYETISAIGETADTYAIFEKAAQNARAGNTAVNESVKFLSVNMKGFGDISFETAQKVSDLGFMTVKLGQTTFPELASNMGKVIPIAGAMGAKMESVYGAVATLTGVTGETAEVSTQLRGVFLALAKPTTAMQEVIRGLGFKSGKAMIKAKGLQGTLSLLKKAAGGSEQRLAEMFGRVEALNAVLALTGPQADTFAQKTKAMYNAVGMSNKAFQQKVKTSKALRERFGQLFNVLRINAGNKILPVINKGLEKILNNYDKISVSVQSFRKYFEGLKPPFNRIVKLAGTIKKELFEGFENAKPTLNWLGNTALPKVVDLLATTIEKGIGVYNFINDNWSKIEPVVVGITAAVVSYKLAMIGLVVAQKAGMIVEGLTKAYRVGAAVIAMYQSGAKVATIAQWAFNAALNANPIGITVAAIGALVGAGYLLYKNWDKVVDVFNAFKNVVMNSAFIKSWIHNINSIVNAAKQSFGGLINFISGIFTGNWEKAWKGVVNAFKGVFGLIGAIVKAPINSAIGLINTAIQRINKISVKIPDWVPGIGGKTFGANIQQIPMLAQGTKNFAGGLAVTGEEGPELLNLPQGTQVTPANRTEKILAGLNNTSNNQSVVIRYEPEIIIQGNADEEVVETALGRTKEDIRRIVEDILVSKRRVSFAD